MKKVRLLCTVFGTAALCGGEINWQNWQAYSHEKLTPQAALKLTAADPVPEIEGVKLSGKNLTVPLNGGDLNDLLNIEKKGFNRVLLVKIVKAAENTTVKLGLGADWWFEIYCNTSVRSA